MAFFIVTAVKTSNLTELSLSYSSWNCLQWAKSRWMRLVGYSARVFTMRNASKMLVKRTCREWDIWRTSNKLRNSKKNNFSTHLFYILCRVCNRSSFVRIHLFCSLSYHCNKWVGGFTQARLVESPRSSSQSKVTTLSAWTLVWFPNFLEYLTLQLNSLSTVFIYRSWCFLRIFIHQGAVMMDRTVSIGFK
jgi:hypothetical protein